MSMPEMKINAEGSAEVLEVFREVSATLLEEPVSSALFSQQQVLLSKAYTVLLGASVDWRNASYSEWQSGISTLIELFASEDKYVRHSAKRVLFLLGSHLEVSVTSAWEALIERLWDGTKIWTTRAAVPAPSAFGMSASSGDNWIHLTTSCKNMAECSDSSDSGALVWSMSWTATTCMLELQRSLLKDVVGKVECLAVFHRVFLRNIASMDCCYLKDEQSVPGGCACLKREEILHTGTSAAIHMLCMADNCSSSDELTKREVLLGSWLHLLSSVMRTLIPDQTQCLTEDYRLQYICVKHIQILLPSLSDLALSVHKHPLRKHSSRQFLRHKLLTVMLKFAEWFAVDQTISRTCMGALHSNSEDIFNASVLQHDVSETSQSCSSSPFSRCVAETSGVDLNISSFGHLHRRCLLLFFKIVSSGSKNSNVQIIEAAKYLKVIPQDDETEHVKEWVSDLVCWLKDQLQKCAATKNALLSASLANQLCISFVQLFVDEDDLLLEMLLQLSDLASVIGKYLVEPWTQETAYAVSAISPLRVYIAFLSLINYDASVLMDILLSKQTGPDGLHYIMRSLRLIHNTWPQFLEYAVQNNEASASMEQVNPTLLCGERAGACMSEMRCSIERLHKKHLFPYNPTPLLKQLRIFEKLMCSGRTGRTVHVPHI